MRHEAFLSKGIEVFRRATRDSRLLEVRRSRAQRRRTNCRFAGSLPTGSMQQKSGICAANHTPRHTTFPRVLLHVVPRCRHLEGCHFVTRGCRWIRWPWPCGPRRGHAYPASFAAFAALDVEAATGTAAPLTDRCQAVTVLSSGRKEVRALPPLPTS